MRKKRVGGVPVIKRGGTTAVGNISLRDVQFLLTAPEIYHDYRYVRGFKLWFAVAPQSLILLRNVVKYGWCDLNHGQRHQNPCVTTWTVDADLLLKLCLDRIADIFYISFFSCSICFITTYSLDVHILTELLQWRTSWPPLEAA